MFLPRSDVFKDIRQETIAELSDAAVEEEFPAGTVVFSQNDPAQYLYFLVEGEVELIIGNGANSHYTVNGLGEMFGWSSVVNRDCYSAKALCLKPSRAIKIDKAGLEKVFDAHPRSGQVFYRRLAEALGQRWLDLHHSLISLLQQQGDVSYGSGQVINAGDD